MTPSEETAETTNDAATSGNRLMVAAVDRARGIRLRTNHQRGEPAARPDVDGMGDSILRNLDGMIQVGYDRRRDVLHQRAARGDVEHLDAAADREERHVARERGLRQRDLERIARGVRAGPSGAPVHRIAPDRRRRRRSAAARRCGPGLRGRIVARLEQQRLAAGALDRFDIVVDPRAAA